MLRAASGFDARRQAAATPVPFLARTSRWRDGGLTLLRWGNDAPLQRVSLGACKWPESEYYQGRGWW